MSIRARYWYGYNGIGNIHIASSYILLPVDNKPKECIGPSILCAIYAYSRFRSLTPPSLSSNINNYITIANVGMNNSYPLNSPIAFVYKKTLEG